jgi:two-component system, chemotaxis family, sensor kinase CheA
MASQNMNDEIRSVFLEEMSELLIEIERDLLLLEEAPESSGLVSRLFRNIHTIKGGAGMVGLDQLANFTHKLENLLDEIRKGLIPLNAGVTNLLLKATDCLESLMKAVWDQTVVDPLVIDPIVRDLLDMMDRKTGQAELAISPTVAILPESPVVAEQPVAPAGPVNVFLIHINADLAALPSPAELATIEGQMVALGDLITISHQMSLPSPDKRLLGGLYLWRTYQITTSQSAGRIEDIFGLWKGVHEIHVHDLDDLPDAPVNQNEIDAHAAIGLPTVDMGIRAAASAPLQTTTSMNVDTSSKLASAPMSPNQPARLPKAETVLEQPVTQKLTSIRVDINKLDRLVNLVGELITIGARLDSFKSVVERRDRALADSLIGILDDSSRSLRELQDQAMTIRMVPIGGVFDPMTRLVRDFSQQTGKNVRLTITGKDTEVDKKVSEQISGPLKHLIRNSLDHGIESPEEREAAGKAPEAEIMLNTYSKNGMIIIEVTDDGRGIDIERVVQSAKAKGLVDQNRDFSEREALELIFMPAVSSAEKVTEISGRGVGMDVVKRDIEELRGTVDVVTQRGRGTTVSVRIPMTLSIVDGLLVEIGGHNYVIPLSFVEECVELATSASAGSNFLDIRNDLVPFMRLRELFGISGDPPGYEKVVIVSTSDRRVGLVVDRLVGDHQTVIKSLSRLHKDVQCFSGATILGDGSVVLILDVVRLIELGQAREEQLRLA